MHCLFGAGLMEYLNFHDSIGQRTIKRVEKMHKFETKQAKYKNKYTTHCALLERSRC